MRKNDSVARRGRGLLDKVVKLASGSSTSGGARLSHLDSGDAARDRCDWSAAAFHYRDALGEQPSLRHIWIQLGHAEKESGEFDAAEEAYRKAEELGRGDGEPALHLGHVAKLRGNLTAAKRHYLRAIDENPDNGDAMRELASFARGQAIAPGGLRKALDRRARGRNGGTEEAEAAAAIAALMERRRGEIDSAALQTLDAVTALLSQWGSKAAEGDNGSEDASTSSRSIVFDASDLFSYFRNARLPTGIQRVQIEVISHALSGCGTASVCFFTDISDHWIEVPRQLFLELAVLALKDGDHEAPEWLAALDELDALRMFEEPMQFERGAFLVNLGTSWWLQNYFLFVRAAKEAYGIRYVPFVHDFIPIMAPEHCVKELTQDFVSWTSGVFQHADFFLANSEATKSDLKKVAAILGHKVGDDRIAVIPLDADFTGRRERNPLPDAALAKWRLDRNGYVLIVSTIESRKNHSLAFDAWLDLIERHGADSVPRLVCVGNRGWLNDAVHARLQNEALRERVLMLSRLADEELALLYRNCLFTLYPSLYEGWGLPVTESLCHARVPLISDASSLPEAGGEFAVYFASGARRELVEKLETLIYDEQFRREREQLIREKFRPRSWTAIADQIQASLRGFAQAAADSDPMATAFPAELGKYHPIERNFERSIWKGYVSGEIYRAGPGWWGPDSWGCWTRPEGAKLRMRVPEGHGALRAYFLLKGLPDKDCRFAIDVNHGMARRSGMLHAGESRWATLDIPEGSDGGLIEVTFKGAARTDLSSQTDNLDRRVVSLGVSGFFLCDAADVLTRLAISEAIALNDHKAMAFNNPRDSDALYDFCELE
jgi:glycosyltransferase involved in cell wall biosynthesis